MQRVRQPPILSSGAGVKSGASAPMTGFATALPSPAQADCASKIAAQRVTNENLQSLAILIPPVFKLAGSRHVQGFLLIGRRWLDTDRLEAAIIGVAGGYIPADTRFKVAARRVDGGDGT